MVGESPPRDAGTATLRVKRAEANHLTARETIGVIRGAEHVSRARVHGIARVHVQVAKPGSALWIGRAAGRPRRHLALWRGRNRGLPVRCRGRYRDVVAFTVEPAATDEGYCEEKEKQWSHAEIPGKWRARSISLAPNQPDNCRGLATMTTRRFLAALCLMLVVLVLVPAAVARLLGVPGVDCEAPGPVP